MAYTEISGKKLQRKLGAQLNESAAVQISKDSFAQKMMRRMGWQEGQGLGKDQQGMKEHIKVKQRLEEEGIGHDKFQMEKAIAGDCWWQQSMGDTLARLQKQKRKILDETKEKTKKKPKKRKIDEESDDENGDERKLKKRKKEKKKKKEKVKKFYTDEELFEATGGARFGMRAQRRQHGKWARAESGISAEEEAIAMNAMEWDGTGKAQFASSSLNELNTKTSITTYDTEKVIASSAHEVSTSSENSEPNDNTGRDDLVIKEEKVEMKTKKVKKNKSDKKEKKIKKSKKCAR